MSLRQFEFLLQETFTGIRRNAFMSMAAISTIAVSLVLLGGVRLATTNLEELAGTLTDRFEMRAFLKIQIAGEARTRLWKEISSVPGVTGCRLVTREDAWPDLQKRLEGAVDLGDLQGVNPLPDSFVIRVRDLTQMAAIANRIRGFAGVDEVTDTHEAAERVAALTRVIMLGGTFAALLLFIAAAVIVSNTIRLTVYVRRLEISIMQMVGATNWFIRLPFLFEGVFHGVMGAALAMAMLALGYSYLHGEIRRAVPFLEVLPPTNALFLAQAGILAAVGAGLGLASSYLSVRRYLR